jgi:hypothetical protein
MFPSSRFGPFSGENTKSYAAQSQAPSSYSANNYEQTNFTIPNNQTKPLFSGKQLYCVCTGAYDSCTIRALPRIDSAEIGHINNFDSIDVINEINGFYRLGSTRGYVIKQVKNESGTIDWFEHMPTGDEIVEEAIYKDAVSRHNGLNKKIEIEINTKTNAQMSNDIRDAHLASTVASFQTVHPSTIKPTYTPTPPPPPPPAPFGHFGPSAFGPVVQSTETKPVIIITPPPKPKKVLTLEEKKKQFIAENGLDLGKYFDKEKKQKHTSSITCS